MTIDARAVVDSKAKIAATATIGPYTVIGPDVEIGEHTWVGPQVCIKGRTRIGAYNKIYQFASIGEDPQDLKYKGEDTLLEIGDRNLIREFCTFNRGTVQGGGITKVGNDNLFMAYVHLAHDCIVHNHTIFSNNASLAGHVIVEDYVILGGLVGVHQFCRLGKHSFLGGGSLVDKDVPPYVRAAGSYAKPFGLNSVGLERRGFDAETQLWLKRAYKTIYREGLTIEEAIAKLKTQIKDCAEIAAYVEFLENSKRGIVR